MIRALNYTNRTADGYLADWLAIPESDAQVRATSNFGDKPLIVLSAGEHGMPAEMRATLEAQWLEFQKELASLSTNHSHRIYPQASHSSLLTSEKDAQLTTRAILDLVNAVRTDQPLAE
jgi:hypothetical protein